MESKGLHRACVHACRKIKIQKFRQIYNLKHPYPKHKNVLSHKQASLDGVRINWWQSKRCPKTWNLCALLKFKSLRKPPELSLILHSSQSLDITDLNKWQSDLKYTFHLKVLIPSCTPFSENTSFPPRSWVKIYHCQSSSTVKNMVKYLLYAVA